MGDDPMKAFKVWTENSIDQRQRMSTPGRRPRDVRGAAWCWRASMTQIREEGEDWRSELSRKAGVGTFASDIALARDAQGKKQPEPIFV